MTGKSSFCGIFFWTRQYANSGFYGVPNFPWVLVLAICKHVLNVGLPEVTMLNEFSRHSLKFANWSLVIYFFYTSLITESADYLFDIYPIFLIFILIYVKAHQIDCLFRKVFVMSPLTGGRHYVFCMIIIIINIIPLSPLLKMPLFGKLIITIYTNDIW